MNYEDADKSNDKIYVDTDCDKDISEEKEMRIYREAVKAFEDEVIFEMDENNKIVKQDGKLVVKDEYKEAYNKLTNTFANAGTGENIDGTKYNFVISTVENRDGQWIVNIGYDGGGHGTHVAGDAAGNGQTEVPFMNTELKDSEGNQITDGTVKGSAPGAQIMALRVFNSDGGTPTSAYMTAMEYACENGADVINMSLGSLPDINDENTPAAKLANRLSKEYGTVFCISAGNEGPVTNSVGTPGTSEWAFTIGAYAASFLNYGTRGMEDGLHEFSSRGPTEDGRLKPTFVAPGDMISASTMWSVNSVRPLEEGGGDFVPYEHMQGTSMSSPYAAGVVASMKQAINEKDLPYHPLVLKEAIFETGKKDLHGNVYKPSEIGGGLIDPEAAIKYLEELKANGLTQESLEAEQGYIERNDIVLKSEFNYTETLDYKTEGLYLRSGEIPNTVDVTITNDKDVDVNVDLVKDSYDYSNDWLKLPQETLSLKAGQSKTLTLRIDKSKLNRGTNSVMIKMDDKNTPLQEGFIPVTVVNYLDLSLDNTVVSENESREFKPGDWDNHFINIPKGVNKVEVTIDFTNPQDGGAYFIHLAKPSGVTVEGIAPRYLWGKGREGKPGKVTFELVNPTPGTWEIGLSSYKSIGGLVGSVISEEAFNAANGKHTITAKIKDVAFEPGVIEYSGKAGEYIEKDLNLRVLNCSEDNKNITIKASKLSR